MDPANTYAGNKDLDQLVIDAICMRLSAGIEVLARIDLALRTNLFGDNWQFMWGMRNRIAHGYLLVDSDIVRQAVEVDLPDIRSHDQTRDLRHLIAAVDLSQERNPCGTPTSRPAEDLRLPDQRSVFGMSSAQRAGSSTGSLN